LSRFLERLEQGPPVVADGGTGALLSARVPRLRVPEEANLRAPEAVIAVHTAFIAAGAELTITSSTTTAWWTWTMTAGWKQPAPGSVSVIATVTAPAAPSTSCTPSMAEECPGSGR
jgi:hypothetical protein